MLETQVSRSILLVGNNPLEARIIERAFMDLKVTGSLVHSIDGEGALVHLRNQNETRPWLILLNLDLPKMTGLRFLETIKSDKVFKMIPVVILSTSVSQDIVTQSFELGAAGYIIKSLEHQQLIETLETIVRYWTLCERPLF